MSMYPIASYTVTGAGQYGVTFSTIPQIYTHLQIRIFGRSSYQSGYYDSLAIRLNGDQTNTDYYSHTIYGNGSSGSSTAYQTVAGGAGLAGSSLPSPGSLANTYACYVVDILDYASTTKSKVIKSFGGWDDNNTSSGIGNVGLFSSVLLPNTNPITSVTPATFQTLAVGTRFDLYGITTSNVGTF